MSEIKPLIIGMAIIIFGGMFIGAFLSPFVDINDIDNNWVDDYYITDTVNVTFSILKAPINIIGDIIQGFDRLFNPVDKSSVYISISNTGVHNGNTLDGIYYFDGYNDRLNGLHFKRNDTKDFILIEATKDTSEETYELISGNIYYYQNLFSVKSIYESVGTGETLVNNWVKTDMNFNFNLNAVGSFSIDESSIDELSNFNGQIRDTMNRVQTKVVDNVRVFGVLPEAVGLPIILLILVGFIFTVIKIIRG